MQTPRIFVLLSIIILPAVTQYCYTDDDIYLSEDSKAIQVDKPIHGLSNLHQLRRNTPMAVTVIDAKKIKTLGLYTLTDVFRLFPGMRINSGKARLPLTNYLGSNGFKNRTGLTLNGHDYLQAFRHQAIWDQFNVQDIKQVSLARDPGGSSFGDSSFIGQINIETLEPQTQLGFSSGYTIGSQSTGISNISGSGLISDNVDFSLTASTYKHDGFNFEADHETERHDYHDVRRINTKINYTGATHVVNFYAGFYLGEKGGSVASNSPSAPIGNDPNDPLYKSKQDIFIDYTQYVESNSLTLSGGYQKHASNQEWDACNSSIMFSPALAQLGEYNQQLASDLAFGSVYSQELTKADKQGIVLFNTERAEIGEQAYQKLSCLRFEQSLTIERFDIRASYEMQLNENFRVVIGSNVYTENLASEVYFDGRVQTQNFSFFGQSEYIDESFTINLGMSAENGSAFDSTALAYRAGINYHIDDNNTLRFSYSTGYRTPDTIETHRDWGYTGSAIGENPYGLGELAYFYRNVNTDAVEVEKIQAYEMSYLFQSILVDIDLKIFQNRLNNLIQDRLTFYQNSLENTAESIISGIEFDINGTVAMFDLGIVYSYIDTDTGDDIEKILHTSHQGAIYSIANLEDNQTMAIAFYGNSAFNDAQYGRTDLVYNKSWFASKSEISTQIKYSYFTNDMVSAEGPSGGVDSSYLDTKNQFFISLAVTF